MAESGVPGYEVSGWFGLLAPAGTPQAIRDTLQQALAAAVRQPDVAQRMLELGAQPIASTPEDFGRRIPLEVRKWQDVVKATGLSLE